MIKGVFRTVIVTLRSQSRKHCHELRFTGLALSLYPDTLHLKTHVHTRPLGQRPFVELEPTDHPLVVEQQEGITMARVREMAEALLHRGDGNL